MGEPKLKPFSHILWYQIQYVSPICIWITSDITWTSMTLYPDLYNPIHISTISFYNQTKNIPRYTKWYLGIVTIFILASLNASFTCTAVTTERIVTYDQYTRDLFL